MTNADAEKFLSDIDGDIEKGVKNSMRHAYAKQKSGSHAFKGKPAKNSVDSEVLKKMANLEHLEKFKEE